MTSSDTDQIHPIKLLERAISSNRIAHAYLISGEDLASLEEIAIKCANMILCEKSYDQSAHPPCGQCQPCRLMSKCEHPDVHIVRPKSKLRMILIDQMRELMREVQLKPVLGGYKIGIIVAADRMNTDAANAFLKTLEEPPPNSVIFLLSTEPHRLLETIRSRCLQISLGAETSKTIDSDLLTWLEELAKQLAECNGDILSRYRLLSYILKKLQSIKSEIESQLSNESPLVTYAEQEVDEETRKRWKDELTAQIEAAYREQRTELMRGLIKLFRDVWILTMGLDEKLLYFRNIAAIKSLAKRLTPVQAMTNIQLLHRAQKLLFTNAQELLVLEVTILQLKL